MELKTKINDIICFEDDPTQYQVIRIEPCGEDAWLIVGKSLKAETDYMCWFCEENQYMDLLGFDTIEAMDDYVAFMLSRVEQ